MERMATGIGRRGMDMVMTILVRARSGVAAVLIIAFFGVIAPCQVFAQPYDEKQITAYVDAAFEGMTMPIRKWPGPIIAKIIWPGCEDVADRILPNENFLILATDKPEEIPNDKKIVDIFMAGGTSRDHVDNEFSKMVEAGRIIRKAISNERMERVYSISIVNRTIISNNTCERHVSRILFDDIVSFFSMKGVPRSIVTSGDAMTGFDLAFLSALYDPLISIGERPESAKPKILKLMTAMLQGRK
jgi:hypothetical protein